MVYTNDVWPSPQSCPVPCNLQWVLRNVFPFTQCPLSAPQLCCDKTCCSYRFISGQAQNPPYCRRGPIELFSIHSATRLEAPEGITRQHNPCCDSRVGKVLESKTKPLLQLLPPPVGFAYPALLPCSY